MVSVFFFNAAFRDNNDIIAICDLFKIWITKTNAYYQYKFIR